MTKDSDEETVEFKMASQLDPHSGKAFLASEGKEDQTLTVDTPIDVTPDVPDVDDSWSDSDDDEEKENRKSNLLAKIIITIQDTVTFGFIKLSQVTRGYLFTIVLLIAYCVYFVLAMNYEFGSESSVRLLVCTILGVLISTRHRIFEFCSWTFKRLYGSDKLSTHLQSRLATVRFFIRWIFYGLLAALTIWILVDQGRKDRTNLRSLSGLVIFPLICLLMSTHPAKINWHTIYWSFALQFLAALFVLKLGFGKDMILWVQARLDEFFANAAAGSRMLFGESYKDHFLIFGGMPMVFLTNAALTILFYLGAIQFVVNIIGKVLSFVLDASPVESVAVTSGIFLEGFTALLTLRPYLPYVSRSQLFLIITSVFGSLGGTYMSILSSLGISLEYLIPGMLISAPATFAVCKLMMPETNRNQGHTIMDRIDSVAEEKKKYSSILDAAQTGASSMLPLVGNVVTIIFAFYSFISWLNHTLAWFGDRVGIEDLSVELIASYLFYPVALIMGIEPDDCRNVAMLLGYRIGVDNFVAFLTLAGLKVNKAKYMHYMLVTNGTGPVIYTRDDIVLGLWNDTLKHGFISDRSEAIITYCLCGFSSCAAVAMTTGIMINLVPTRKAFITKVSFTCLIAGNIANCMTGCFASKMMDTWVAVSGDIYSWGTEVRNGPLRFVRGFIQPAEDKRLRAKSQKLFEKTTVLLMGADIVTDTVIPILAYTTTNRVVGYLFMNTAL